MKPSTKKQIQEKIISIQVDMELYQKNEILTPSMLAHNKSFIEALKWVLNLEKK